MGIILEPGHNKISLCHINKDEPFTDDEKDVIEKYLAKFPKDCRGTTSNRQSICPFLANAQRIDDEAKSEYVRKKTSSALVNLASDLYSAGKSVLSAVGLTSSPVCTVCENTGIRPKKWGRDK